MYNRAKSVKRYIFYAAMFTVALFVLTGLYWLQGAQDKRVILIVTKDQSDTASLNPTRVQIAAELALEDYMANWENPLQIVHEYITYTGDEEEGYIRAKAYLEENAEVIALVGDFNSAGTEYMALLAAEQQIPHLSFFATDEEIFVERPWSFSYRTRIGHEMETMMELLVEHLETQDIVILACEQRNLLPRAGEFHEMTGIRSVDVLQYHIFPQDKNDFQREINQLAQNSGQFDALVLFLTAYQLEHFLQQLAQSDLDKPVLTTGIIIHPDLLSSFKGVDHSLYTIVPGLFFQLNNDIQLQSFVQRYMVEAGFHRIDSLGPWIYDGFWTLYGALEHAATRQQLKEALENYDHERFVGCVCFDEGGLLEKNLFVPVRIRSGSFEEVPIP